MRLRLVRNATLILEAAGLRLLVDPLLSEAGAYPAIEGTANPVANPTVPLPAPVEEILAGTDAALVTHLHNDHFDLVAAERLPPAIPLLCQPPDEPRLRERGFTDVRPVADRVTFEGLAVSRTGGRHGHGRMAELLGPVSGFVVSASKEPTIYIAGDTVW